MPYWSDTHSGQSDRMPKLIRFLAFHAAIGFALALAFVVALLGFNVMNMRDLIMTSEVKWVAILALTILMTITFASVQMGVAIMCMPYDDTENGPPERAVSGKKRR